MHANITGNYYTAYESNVADFLVVLYDVAGNEYLTYRCPLTGNRVDFLNCEPVESFYVCGINSVRYCVNTNTTSNIYLDVIACEGVNARDLNESLGKCPARLQVMRWAYARRETRRRIYAECRDWFSNYGSGFINDYLDEVASRMITNAEQWVANCYNVSTSPDLTFLGTIADYVTEGEFISWSDETRLMHARCDVNGNPVNPVIRRRYGACP